MQKRIPKFKSDQDAEDFLNQDLTDYISRENFIESPFEFAPKDKSITFRVSDKLLKAVQREAKKRGVNYQKLIREAIEQFLSRAA